MKIAICDDEEIWRRQLMQCLEGYYKSLDVLIQSFSSGEELLQHAQKNRFDLFFLDIEMPQMDGFEVAKRLRQQRSDSTFIFLTSHTDLAMEGYEVEAFRFLAKPIAKDKLYAALQAFEKRLYADRRIAVTESGTQKYIRCQEIRYIKSENVYLRIETETEHYLIRRKLKELSEELPKDLFVTVHRSYIINMSYVKSYGGNEILLDDGTEIPVSKANRDRFRQKMMQYMKEKC